VLEVRLTCYTKDLKEVEWTGQNSWCKRMSFQTWLSNGPSDPNLEPVVLLNESKIRGLHFFVVSKRWTTSRQFHFAAAFCSGACTEQPIWEAAARVAASVGVSADSAIVVRWTNLSVTSCFWLQTTTKLWNQAFNLKMIFQKSDGIFLYKKSKSSFQQLCFYFPASYCYFLFTI